MVGDDWWPRSILYTLNLSGTHLVGKMEFNWVRSPYIVVRPVMKKARSVTIYPPPIYTSSFNITKPATRKTYIMNNLLTPFPLLYVHLCWIRWFLFFNNTLGSASREAMYLDGVGPNSSVDCFGFVTVQMTFNGLGLGVSGRNSSPKRGGSRSLGGVLREADFVWREIFQESWVMPFSDVIFLFCLEREAYVGHQCVFCCMSVCFDVGYLCWIVEPLLIWNYCQPDGAHL